MVETADNDSEVRWGRNAMLGFVVGFFAVALGITIAGTLGGMGVGPSLGVGAFVGSFGGGGFGFMMGATIPLARTFEARDRRS